MCVINERGDKNIVYKTDKAIESHEKEQNSGT